MQPHLLLRYLAGFCNWKSGREIILSKPITVIHIKWDVAVFDALNKLLTIQYITGNSEEVSPYSYVTSQKPKKNNKYGRLWHLPIPSTWLTTEFLLINNIFGIYIVSPTCVRAHTTSVPDYFVRLVTSHSQKEIIFTVTSFMIYLW